jgi:hypothetical protein
MRNYRRVIIVFGLVVILCSLAALAYAFWPLEALHELTPLAPTLFAPP